MKSKFQCLKKNLSLSLLSRLWFWERLLRRGVAKVFTGAAIGEARLELDDGDWTYTSEAFLVIFVLSCPELDNEEEPTTVGLAERWRFPFFFEIAPPGLNSGLRWTHLMQGRLDVWHALA